MSAMAADPPATVYLTILDLLVFVMLFVKDGWGEGEELEAGTSYNLSTEKRIYL